MEIRQLSVSTTGDSIVPAEVEYPCPMLFEDRYKAYVTILWRRFSLRSLKRSSAEVLPIHVEGLL